MKFILGWREWCWKINIRKIILGAYKVDSGQTNVDGEKICNKSQGSCKNWFCWYFSELSLLSVDSCRNIAMGENQLLEFLFLQKNKRKSFRVMERFNLYVKPDAIVGSLSVAEQQKVEI